MIQRLAIHNTNHLIVLCALFFSSLFTLDLLYSISLSSCSHSLYSSSVFHSLDFLSISNALLSFFSILARFLLSLPSMSLSFSLFSSISHFPNFPSSSMDEDAWGLRRAAPYIVSAAACCFLVWKWFPWMISWTRNGLLLSNIQRSLPSNPNHKNYLVLIDSPSKLWYQSHGLAMELNDSESDMTNEALEEARRLAASKNCLVFSLKKRRTTIFATGKQSFTDLKCEASDTKEHLVIKESKGVLSVLSRHVLSSYTNITGIIDEPTWTRAIQQTLAKGATLFQFTSGSTVITATTTTPYEVICKVLHAPRPRHSSL